jgi:hypothetical protein
MRRRANKKVWKAFFISWKIWHLLGIPFPQTRQYVAARFLLLADTDARILLARALASDKTPSESCSDGCGWNIAEQIGTISSQ